MNLKELLDRYSGVEEFEVWKVKFPDMYAFSEEVEVIPWEEEFGIADRNPEVMDEIEFYEMLLKNGMISEEEFQKKLRSLPPASKTEGIAFIEEKKVSFRRRHPSLGVMVHELGHVYFEEPDPIWSSVYGGGEYLMGLIVRGFVDGNEGSIRIWHKLMHLAYEEPEKALSYLDRMAEEVGKELGVNFTKEELFESNTLERRPIFGLMLFTGAIPDTEGEKVQPILVEILVGTRFGEGLFKRLLLKILQNPS